MDTWRLIPLEVHNAFMNMAIDEAILQSRTENLVPNTIRFYQWQPSAVSVGKNQNIEDNVYVENCNKLGVNIVRRNSGGGTVFHDQTGEVTYSVTAQIRDLEAAEITTVYTRIYAAITDALRLLGMPADFSAGNQKNCPNLTVNTRKISGSAQTVKRNIVQQHGTLLLDANLPLMFQLLRIKGIDNCAIATQVAQRKITSIQNELGHAIAPTTVVNALTQGFKATLKIRLNPAQLTLYEKALAKKLYNSKYATDNWNQNGKA
ncbi:lipoate--protein ligase family protein [Candidatus Bathyarchaeota archaeon]|nr:lipoate--protein ligase family protein [Candidatus Bathyarchaeota archaeon]